MAEEREDQPGADATEEQATQSSQETAVGHSVVDPAGAVAAADAAPAPAPPAPPQPAAAPATSHPGTSPAAADRKAAAQVDQFAEKPELFVGGAFVGAFVFGKLLKKLTGSDN
jgi:hypothetical protein